MIQFEINITDTCPAKCHDCIMSEYKSPDSSIIELLNKTKEITNMLVWATGGEPLLRPDLVESILKTGVDVQIVTTGVFNEDKLVNLMKSYSNARRVNVSILGDPEFERGFKKIEGDFERKWLWSLNRNKVNIIFVVYRNELKDSKVFDNLRYVFENYGYFNICLLYDRCDRFTKEELIEIGLFVKNLSVRHGVEVMVFPERLVWPTIFVSGKELKYYFGRCLSSIPIKTVLEDTEGFIDTVVSGYTLNKLDSLRNCSVYSQYKGCGGPGCRYGYIKECEDFWSQFIIPSKLVKGGVLWQ